MLGSGRQRLTLGIRNERAFGRGSSAEVQKAKSPAKERSKLRSRGRWFAFAATVKGRDERPAGALDSSRERQWIGVHLDETDDFIDTLRRFLANQALQDPAQERKTTPVPICTLCSQTCVVPVSNRMRARSGELSRLGVDFEEPFSHLAYAVSAVRKLEAGRDLMTFCGVDV
jgi:hypothetical protein